MGLPDPITRKEVYLNAAAGGSGTDTLPDPITREETYLKAIAENGGGGGGSGDVKGVKGNAESTYRKGNVNLTPANLGLGNVDNTSDLNKPISTATQSALNGKQNVLTAGDNITIEVDPNTGDTVISSTGGGGGGGGGGDVTGVKGSAESTYRTGNVTISPANIGVEAGAQVNVQSDWNQSDDTQDDFIKNKPTIPAAQVNADWTASSGVAEILHKPTLGTAAAKDSTNAVTTGSTNLVESGAVKSAIDTAVSGKTDKVSGGTTDNFAALDSSGNLKDSGHKHSDYLTQHQDITGKADKVSSATENNFAALDANGNLKDSGHKHSDYLTQHQDITGKADKVSSATSGDLAGLDGNGNLTDSGVSSAIFPSTASSSNKLATMNDIPGGGGLGTKLTSTVSNDSLTFTNVAITSSAVIDGPYIQGVLIGLLELDDSTTGTLVYTLEDDSADGATAYIWVRS